MVRKRLAAIVRILRLLRCELSSGRIVASRARGGNVYFSCGLPAGPDIASREHVPALPAFSGINLFAGLVFSSIGFVGFIYGKRMNLLKPVLLGIALMAYPYFIENTIVLCVIGLLGTAALFLFRE